MLLSCLYSQPLYYAVSKKEIDILKRNGIQWKECLLKPMYHKDEDDNCSCQYIDGTEKCYWNEKKYTSLYKKYYTGKNVKTLYMKTNSYLKK